MRAPALSSESDDVLKDEINKEFSMHLASVKTKTNESLVPFEQLSGEITRIKEIPLEDGKVERWYSDSKGNRAIRVMKALPGGSSVIYGKDRNFITGETDPGDYRPIGQPDQTASSGDPQEYKTVGEWKSQIRKKFGLPANEAIADFDTKLERFRRMVEDEYNARLKKDWDKMSKAGTTPNVEFPDTMKERVTAKPGKKYTKIDVRSSGKYMVNNSTGDIFGIKAYGVPHLGKRYGNLDTIDQYDWSGYEAHRVEKKEAAPSAFDKAPEVKAIDPSQVKVGSFWYTIWGYDQTNVTFYKVVKVDASTAVVQEVANKMVSGDPSHSTMEVPDESRTIGQPKRMRLKVNGGGRTNDGSTGVGNLWPWDGRPVHATHYA